MDAAERDALIARVFATPAGRALLESGFCEIYLTRNAIDEAVARMRLRWNGRDLFNPVPLPLKEPPCASSSSS